MVDHVDGCGTPGARERLASPTRPIGFWWAESRLDGAARRALQRQRCGRGHATPRVVFGALLIVLLPTSLDQATVSTESPTITGVSRPDTDAAKSLGRARLASVPSRAFRRVPPRGSYGTKEG